MFKRRPKTSSNPEVQAAMKEMHDLLDVAGEAVNEVDELLREYEEAEKLRKPWS